LAIPLRYPWDDKTTPGTTLKFPSSRFNFPGFKPSAFWLVLFPLNGYTVPESGPVLLCFSLSKTAKNPAPVGLSPHLTPLPTDENGGPPARSVGHCLLSFSTRAYTCLTWPWFSSLVFCLSPIFILARVGGPWPLFAVFSPPPPPGSPQGKPSCLSPYLSFRKNPFSLPFWFPFFPKGLVPWSPTFLASILTLAGGGMPPSGLLFPVDVFPPPLILFVFFEGAATFC